MIKIIQLFLLPLLFLLTSVTSSWAQIGLQQKNMMRKNEPIEIVSDKMEAFQLKKMVVFSGNAVATQGDIKLKTDRLSIYYKEAAGKKEKVGKQDVAASGELDRIEARGNVIITQKEISATGEEAIYYQDNARIVLSGHPVLKDGNNTIKGCRVIIYINENRGKVEQCEVPGSERVTATIHPQGKK